MDNIINNDSNAGKVQFNAGSNHLQFIHDLIKQISKCYIEGRFLDMFYYIKDLKSNIIGKLTEKEQKLFENYEQKIVLNYKLYLASNNKKYKNDMFFVIENYRNDLMILIDKKEFLVPGKEIRNNLFGQETYYDN